jgi:hypothetical protein
MYTALNDASSILEGKPKPSTPLYTGWIPTPEPVDRPTINIDDTEQMHDLTRRTDFDKSRAIINKAIDKAATKQEEKIWFWTKADTALKMAFLQTLSREVYDAVAGLPTAAEQYAEISHRYKKDGLNEACSAWAEFFKLCCAECSNTIKFTDKFRAALNKLKDLKLVLPEKGILYQFILAIEEMELSMESYIDKLGTNFKRVNALCCYHPLGVKALKLQLCKRLDLCWPQWVHFGSQEHHRTSWNPIKSHGTS